MQANNMGQLVWLEASTILIDGGTSLYNAI